jgi:hypothetical protein
MHLHQSRKCPETRPFLVPRRPFVEDRGEGTRRAGQGGERSRLPDCRRRAFALLDSFTSGRAATESDGRASSRKPASAVEPRFTRSRTPRASCGVGHGGTSGGAVNDRLLDPARRISGGRTAERRRRPPVSRGGSSSVGCAAHVLHRPGFPGRRSGGAGPDVGGRRSAGRYSTTSTFSPRTSLQNRAMSALENSFQPRQGPRPEV